MNKIEESNTMQPVIHVAHVSKKFSRSLKRSMIYGLADIARNVVGLRSASNGLRKDEFWALDDVSFEVKKGETLGLIGANGSGKSTMLKLLNGIFWPDNGKITIAGRVGALIEVGAGFHPMLSGRENIYVNGAILGMSKNQVQEKMNDIIAFADIGDFLDMPVKNYSSGMFVRLGFSIAAHSDPDILLVDEILAVGDADFRAKSMDLMWQISKKQGKAVVLVSHNMVAVEGFCDRVILLEKGVAYEGEKSNLITRYLGCDTVERYSKLSREERDKLLESGAAASGTGVAQTGEIVIDKVHISNSSGDSSRDTFAPTDTMHVSISFTAKKRLENVVCSFMIKDTSGIVLTVDRSRFHGIPPFTVEGPAEIAFELHPTQLKSGKYLLGIGFHDTTHNSVHTINHDHYFTVVEQMPNRGGKEGFFYPNVTWHKKKYEL